MYVVFFALFAFTNCTNGQQKGKQNKITNSQKTIIMDSTEKIVKTEQEWKKLLTPEQFYVLRQKGTEYAFTGQFYKHKEKGVYVCAGCGNELFSSELKYDSGCGWPSFYDELKGGKIKTQTDTSHGMVRTEIMCAKCDGHLGHVFEDGPNPTGLRYCVNSLSLDFKKTDEKEKK